MEAALGRPYPPLATLVAAATARAAGHDVRVHDRTFRRDASEFGGVLEQVSVGRVAICGDDHAVPMKQCLSGIRDATLEMIRAARAAGVPVLVSGPDVSDHPDLYRGAGAAAAVVGDVSAVLADWLAGRSDIQGIHGERGAGGRAAAPADLDALPDADRGDIDLSPYARMWRRRHGAWELNVWTARGCPYRCNWCAKPTWGRSYNARSPERVAAEIATLRRTVRPDRLWFTDDIFALKPEWLSAFRSALDGAGSSGGAVTPYRCLSRPDLLASGRYVADLAATGCRQVWLGAESGSDSVLRAMDKECSVADVTAAVGHLRDHGIAVGLFLQLGYPGESVDDVMATVDMIRRLAPDEIGVSVSYPLPGTPFHARVRDSMRDAHWSGSMENRPLFEAPYPPAFYGAAKALLRSTHSAGQTRAVLARLRERPDRRGLRRLAGALVHRGRLPLVRWRTKRLAAPNPKAVPRTW